MNFNFFTREPRLQELNNDIAEIAQCKYQVDKPVMVHEWNDLTFLHYSYEPEHIANLLPDDLEVELIDGKAWVSLVPFKMHVEFPMAGTIPYLSDFPETNVRTYVTTQDGTRGIWFFSLDASRLLAVGGGRLGYSLSYFWSKMSVEQLGKKITYNSKRRLPGPKGSYLNATIEIGEQYKSSELTELDHKLSAQWILFSRQFGGTHRAFAEHEPWELYKTKLLHIDQNLLQAAGLPAPTSEPIVQYSPGVRVNISLPTKVENDLDTKKIVFFDGICNLCNGALQTLIKIDRKKTLMFSSLQSYTSQNVLKEFGQEIDPENLETIIYLRGNKIYTHSDANIQVLRDIGWPYKALFIFIIIPRPVRDFVYKQIAKRRYKIFGKKESCMVPTPELKSRFLD